MHQMRLLKDAAAASKEGAVLTAATLFKEAIQEGDAAGANTLQALQQFAIENRDASITLKAKETLEQLAKDLAGFPETKESDHTIAMLLYLAGNLRLSADFFHKAAMLDPSDARDRYFHLYVLLELNDVSSAMAAFEDTPTDFQSSSKVRAFVALLRQKGYVAEAKAVCQSIAQICAGEAGAWAFTKLGEMEEDAGDLQAAELRYDEALQACPDYGYGLFRLGCVQEKKGKYAEAMDLYQRSIASDKSLWEPLVRIGWLHVEPDEDYRTAITYYVKAYNMSRDMEILDAIASCYAGLDEYDHAVQIYGCLHNRFSGTSHSWECCGMCLLELGRHEEAVSALLKALDLDPNNVGALDWLSDCYWETEQYEKVVETLRRYLQLAAPRPDILTSLGYAVFKCGDIEAAQKYYGQAIDMKVEEIPVRRAYAEFLSESGDLDGLATQLAIIKNLDPATYQLLSKDLKR